MCFHTTVLSVRGYRGINVIRCFLDIYYKLVDKLVDIWKCACIQVYLYSDNYMIKQGILVTPY